MLLEIQGAKAVVASTGLRAIELIHEDTPQAVVLDAMLPDMHGIDVLKIIRESPKTAQLPVILYTAGLTTEERQEALNLGVEAIISKTEFDEVLKKTAALLENKKSVVL